MDALAIPILALMIPIIVVPTKLAYAHAGHRREFEHKERMFAIESGLVPPSPTPWWTPARVGLLIGCVVPVAALMAAVSGTSIAGQHEQIWMTAAMVGVAGVITGGCLAARPVEAAQPAAYHYKKAVSDPDAFDVVGSRG